MSRRRSRVSRYTRSRQAQRVPAGRPHRRRLRFEPLEDRRLLALVTVDTLSDTVDLGDGVTSLREAIFATNLVGGADTIEFAASLTSGGPATITLTQGELAITDSLTINGPGANLLAIDASGNDPTPDSTLDDGDNTNDGDGSRIFNIDDGNAANLLDVSISDLALTGGDLDGDGGAIRSVENLTVTGSTISGNSSGQSFGGGNGGGIFSRGDLTVSDSTISGNAVGNSGGGIYSAHNSGGNLTVIRSTISSNSTERNTGGGIDFNAPFTIANPRVMTITDSTITGNSTGTNGGGIWAIHTVVTVTGSTISANSAVGGGGGISHQGTGGLTVINSTVSGNAAGHNGGNGSGGGITASILTVTNSTISDNSASRYGGGIRKFGGAMTVITNSTISGNAAGVDGAGIQSLGPTVLSHTIVAENTRGTGEANDVTGSVQVTFSLLGVDTGATITDNGGNLIGTAAAPIDPLLAPLAHNGGPTVTHALLAGSPAINRGDLNAIAGMNGMPEFDQRGTPFGRVFNGRIDIGAFEYQAASDLNLVVDTLADESDGNYALGDLSLREALLLANTYASTDTIHFAPPLAGGTILLTMGELAITNSLAINGPGANLLTIDASGNDPTPDVNNGDGSRVFNIDDVNSANLLGVSISGLTLTGGDVPAAGSAGAIFSRENLILTNSTVTGNSAGRNGGGIYSRDGSLTVTDSTISANSAGSGYGSGGGIRVRDGNLALVGTTISGNSTSGNGNGGGGISISSSSLIPPIVTISESTISGNSAATNGGGIHFSVFNGSLTISNSTISGNSAGRDGGGLRISGGTKTIADTAISGNTAGVDGGAISASGNLIITRGTLIDNSAQSADPSVGRGGAIWTSTSSGSLAIVDSTISGNSASGHGGGLYHGNNVTLTGSTIEKNTSARNGGGIVSYRGNLTVIGSTITGNSAAADGGGIHSRSPGTTAVTGSTISGNSALAGGGINSSFSAIVVTDSALYGNRAGVGGGIRQFNGSLTVTNSTISGNTATGNSGGLYLFTSGSSQFAIRHSTIVSNTASGFGGGISVFGGRLDLDHTILAQNTAALGRDLMPFLGAVIATRFNLIGDNSDSGLVEAPVGSSDANGNLIGTAASPIIPLLGPLASNGGPTMTHLLVVGSPAIDAGDPSAAGGVGTVPASDQRGAPFVRIYGGRIDIGAFERQSLAMQSFIVDTLIDESDGDYSSGDFSLREAIELANGSAGSDAITFAASLTGSEPAIIMLTHGVLQISESMAIDGPGPNLLTIDASGNDPTPDVNNGDGSGVFNLEDYLAYPNQPQVQNVAISGLTLTGGDGGGAIRAGENLTVTNCTISGNSSFAGGGILVSSNVSLQLNVNRTTISDNSALGNIGGGGIAAFGAAIIVTDSAITGNSSLVEGGGITNYRGNLTVNNSTISGNSAAGGFFDGGGISTRSGGTLSPATLTVTNSTISGNAAGTSGGGIRSSSGGGPSTVTVTNSIVAGNTSGAGVASDVAGTVTLSFSLLGVDTGATIVNNGGNLIGTAAAPIDPLLAPLADNGGPMLTHALLPGSPAIDVGSGGGGFDQRGEPFTRVFDGDGDGVARSDIGAFELQPIPAALFGDYSGDGNVDAADYVVWRKFLGATGIPAYSGADGSGNSEVGAEDYGVWSANFGATLAISGSGNAVAVGSEMAVAEKLPYVAAPVRHADFATGTVAQAATATTFAEPQGVPPESFNLIPASSFRTYRPTVARQNATIERAPLNLLPLDAPGTRPVNDLPAPIESLCGNPPQDDDLLAFNAAFAELANVVGSLRVP